MHVCHLTKYYPPVAGGIETHVQTLARRQVELGARVSVVCVDHRESPAKVRGETWEDDHGVRVCRVARKMSLAKWDLCPGLSPLLRKLQEPSNGIDVLHLHTPNPTMTLALRAAGTQKPLLITHHSDVVKQRFLGSALALLERPLMRQSSRVLTTSPCYAQGSRALAPWLPKVETLPLGIELEPLLAPSCEALRYRDEFRSRYDAPLWLCVGRLVYYKGIDVAIRALRRMPGTLLIVGEGPLRRSLERTAHIEGVADRVVWLGKLTNDALVGAYHAATALLFPSNARSEGFGLVQVEAMASGCPVVNTDIPFSGVPWVCPNDDCGLTVPMNDPSALAAAALRLLESERRTRFIDSARRRAIEQFSARTMAERSLRHYRDIVSATAPTCGP
jgi:glycosyltransferase involved in cell wall biosynthesis